MKIDTIISLAGTVTAAGIFTVQKQWLLATVFILLTGYTILERVVHIDEIPNFITNAFPVLALVIAVYEIIRRIATK
ncbi:hypothetical protein GJ699_13430 [Duganella sp. FT80W]|uniref:Uncharacterized protein n=1 Tax=Duganella guangzhouensis TaxID=2666084 RepID=A0A6I2KZL4_9BURK|nr:hypothetical protein [Duganella guangzhouensis]MRW90992.1 hypothetical protein [Duganella guangzhouensis]